MLLRALKAKALTRLLAPLSPPLLTLDNDRSPSMKPGHSQAWQLAHLHSARHPAVTQATGCSLMAKTESIIQDRLRRAALAFQAAEVFFQNADRRMKVRLPAEVDTYWAGLGRQIKEDLRIAVAEVESAFKAASTAGLGICTADQRFIVMTKEYGAKSLKG